MQKLFSSFKNFLKIWWFTDGSFLIKFWFSICSSLKISFGFFCMICKTNYLSCVTMNYAKLQAETLLYCMKVLLLKAFSTLTSWFQPAKIPSISMILPLVVQKIIICTPCALSFPENIRLACQTTINGPVSFRRLLLDKRDLGNSNQLGLLYCTFELIRELHSSPLWYPCKTLKKAIRRGNDNLMMKTSLKDQNLRIR